jgi:hypothetical protein
MGVDRGAGWIEGYEGLCLCVVMTCEVEFEVQKSD